MIFFKKMLLLFNALSIFPPNPQAQKKRKKIQGKKNPLCQLKNLSFIVKSHQSNQTYFQEKKNLILFFNSNKSVPITTVSLLNFNSKTKDRRKAWLCGFSIYFWHSRCLFIWDMLWSPAFSLRPFVVSCSAGPQTLGLCTNVRFDEGVPFLLWVVGIGAGKWLLANRWVFRQDGYTGRWSIWKSHLLTIRACLLPGKFSCTLENL